MRRFITSPCLILVLLVGPPAWAAVGQKSAGQLITGTVKDALGRPLSDVELKLQAAGRQLIGHAASGKKGSFSLGPVAPGVYAVVAEKSGFKPATAIVTVPPSGAPAPIVMAMESEKPLSLKAITAELNRARNRLSPQTGSSLYHFSEQSIQQLPQGEDTPLNQVLLQAPGVVQDSFGALHIRGDHADIQYRINGIQLPEGTEGFGQILDPRFARSIDLLDGALPAQYAYRTAGVVEVHTKDGCSFSGGEAEMFGGQRATLFPSVEYGGCTDRLSFYVTGSYQQNDLGLESATPGVVAINDHTQQGLFFGYASYLVNPETRLSLITGASAINYQIPTEPGLTPGFTLSGAPPSAFLSQNVAETQFQQVYFGILALQGVFGPKTDYQVALFTRYSTLHFTPDPAGDLIFNGIASNVFNTAFAYGSQGDITYRLNSAHTLRTGYYVSVEQVELDSNSAVFPVNSAGMQIPFPIRIIGNANKLTWLGGVYLQDEWRPVEKLTLSFGGRFDYIQEFKTGYEFEPRLGAVYKLTPTTTLHAGYARYFTPPALLNISLKQVQEFQGTTGASVSPVGNPTASLERRDYWDVGALQEVIRGLNVGVDSYFATGHDIIDEGQFGQALIFTPFNYRHGRIYGVEATGSYTGENLSLYSNFAYSVAQGNEVASTQFNFDPAELAYIANHWIYLDHEQLYTVSAGAAYKWRGFVLTLDGIYGSGLRSGFANTDHVPDYVQVNIGLIRYFDVPKLGRVALRGLILNLLDNTYQIRSGSGIGVFAPQYGPRRAAYLSLTVPLPSMFGTNGS